MKVLYKIYKNRKFPNLLKLKAFPLKLICRIFANQTGKNYGKIPMNPMCQKIYKLLLNQRNTAF